MPTPHRDSQGFYTLLGVEIDATENQIQLAYEALAEQAPEGRGATQAQLDRAYSVLKNADSRRAYDRIETSPPPRQRRKLIVLDDVRLLAACVVILVAILAFVWAPLYGSRFRSFSTGDRLVGLKGEPFGVVIQVEESHLFPTGISSAGYLVELNSTKELRWFPAADLAGTCRRAE